MDTSSAVAELAQELGERMACEDNHNPDQMGWRWMFELTRLLRSFEGRPGDYKAAIETFAEATSIDPDEVLLAVHDHWDVVRVPAGQDALRGAVEQATKAPLKLENFPGKLCDLVATVARNLSLMAEDGVIFLPREKLGELLGKSHTAIGHAVSLLVKAGILRELSAEWSYARGVCKTYTVHLPEAKG